MWVPLAPIEVAIREKFIPALFDIASFELIGELRHLLSLVKKGGLAIRFPVEQAATCYKTSRAAVEKLVETLVVGRRLCVRLHKQTMDAAQLASRNERDFDADHFLTQLGREKLCVKRRLERSCETGAWFTLVPSALNGSISILSAEEFRDNVRLRYNPKPLDMPDLCLCDGCGANMTVEHALHCKVGGLVHCRHNYVTREFGFLCQAFSNGATNYEPHTYNSDQRPMEDDAAAATAESATQQHQATDGSNPAPVTCHEDRGDIQNLFWESMRSCIFDTRIVDADARSYRNKAPKAVLRQHEREKTWKYKKACLEPRRYFTPLCNTADGMAGREARNAASPGLPFGVKMEAPTQPP
eukprot:scaffold15910_cov139-Skeletonema_dohrnii-CCMP3373.AAC.2